MNSRCKLSAEEQDKTITTYLRRNGRRHACRRMNAEGHQCQYYTDRTGMHDDLSEQSMCLCACGHDFRGEPLPIMQDYDYDTREEAR